MLRIIGVLLILLTVSVSFNYAQFQKAKAKDLVIETYTKANEELNTEKDKLVKDKESLQNSYDKAMTEVKESDVSFEKLSNNLSELQCSQGKPNDLPKTKPNKTVSVDSDVSKYYNILRTAYSLQNKN